MFIKKVILIYFKFVRIYRIMLKFLLANIKFFCYCRKLKHILKHILMIQIVNVITNFKQVNNIANNLLKK